LNTLRKIYSFFTKIAVIENQKFTVVTSAQKATNLNVNDEIKYNTLD